MCTVRFLLATHLSEMLLSLQEFLFPGSRISQELIPAFHQGSMPGLDGLGLDVLGCKQLVFQSSDICNSLLLESLQSSIKCFLRY